MTTSPLTSVRLESRFATELPALAVPWQADEVADPRLLVLNEDLAVELGLDPEALRTPEGVRFLVGNEVPDHATPVAQGYAGHQFGGWSPRLGDGRALLLGELTDGRGRVRDLHLKGSGRTPWARGGDGLASIGPMLREYVVSEGMHALGIPTTRSLAVVATGRPVRRETVLPGAVLARVATSHLRVGSFQYAASLGDLDLLRALTDHAIERHHPAAAEAETPALALLEAVVAVQASLVARWMLVGFVHGVMNTDNMTISGETIDYGPCAFLEGYDPSTSFSSIDTGGRYAYGNQPSAALWNLARLAEALLPLVDDDTDRAIERATGPSTASGSTTRRRGATAWAPSSASPRPHPRTPRPWARSCSRCCAPATWTGRRSGAPWPPPPAVTRSRPASGSSTSRRSTTGRRWRALGPDAAAMDRVNPVYVPRNHLVEEALDAGVAGDLAPLQRLLEALADPFTERPGFERHAAPAPDDFGRYTTYCGT